jgi:hypothetical protein
LLSGAFPLAGKSQLPRLPQDLVTKTTQRSMASFT